MSVSLRVVSYIQKDVRERGEHLTPLSFEIWISYLEFRETRLFLILIGMFL